MSYWQPWTGQDFLWGCWLEDGTSLCSGSTSRTCDCVGSGSLAVNSKIEESGLEWPLLRHGSGANNDGKDVCGVIAELQGGVEREWPSDIVILFFCERRWTLR